MHNQYILRLNLLVNDDIDNISTQNKIENAIANVTEELSNNLKCDIINVSSQYTDLAENLNYGKCVKCGTWTSDCRNDNYVVEFSNGAILDDSWYCDICLPKDHPNHF